MLHTNISSRHSSYLFNDNNINFKPLFKEQIPPVVQVPLINIVQAEVQIIDKPLDNTPEHQNISLAREISIQRRELKSSLARIPLATLCLLNLFGQASPAESDIGLENEEADALSALNVLSESYQQALKFAQGKNNQGEASIAAMAQLAQCFENFPFTAEQLKKITTIVTYAYYLQRGSLLRDSSRQAESVILKRMLKLCLLDEQDLVKALTHIGWLNPINADICAFLLPVDDEKQHLVSKLLSLEENWLAARQKLALANERLVLYLANQYKGGFLDFNDLVQEGQSGLLKAVDRFDHERGFKFSTYAVYWIRQGISRSLTRNERVVRLPFGQMANISKIHRAKEAYFLKTGTEISVKDLAEQTDLSDAEVNSILLISQTATSLDNPIGDDEDASTLADFMEQHTFEAPMTTIADAELSNSISAALNSLSDKEAQVICCRFGLNSAPEMTLEDIGHELNLTRERVRQIQVSALKKIKANFGEHLVHFLS